MNYKSILYFLGIYTFFVSIFSILNILYSVYFDFIIDLNSYLITLIISLILGSIFCYIGYKHSKNISLTDQIIFGILSFIFIPLLISIPYFLSIYNFSFLDSYFESVSGLTTTGFSIVGDIRYIDEPLLLWRSSSQWLGGLLFLLLTIGTIGSKQIKIKPAYLLSGGASGRNFYNNFSYNLIKIFLIFFFSTVFLIFLYSINNIRLFDSFNLAFTVISSGGFIPTENLSKILTTNFQVFILSFTLLIPIFNFFLLFDIVTRKFNFKNYQEDLHISVLIILIIMFLY